MNKQNNPLLSFDAISSGLLIALAFLLPIFFIPASNFPIDVAKGSLLAICVCTSFLIWLIARLREGALYIPKSFLLFSAAVITAVFLASSLFSPSMKVSLFGLGNETGTFVVFLALFLLMFLSSVFFQNMNRIQYFYSALVVSTFVLTLYQGARFIFGTGFLSFSVFTSATSNLFGKYNDMALFFGLMAVFSLATLQLLASRDNMNVVPRVLLVASLFFLAIANFSLAWILVGIFSVIILIYQLWLRRRRGKETGGISLSVDRMQFVPFTVAIVSLLFLLPWNFGSMLGTRLGVSQVEVLPSWGATVLIASRTLSSHPVFGIGPNRFEQQWLSLKPNGINNTSFWDANFTSGTGMIPTFATTLGTVGIIAWALFLLSFLYIGVRALFVTHKNRLINYLIFSSFLSALYLWIAAVFYVPNIVNLSLAFMFTGIFAAVLVKAGTVKIYKVSAVDNPKISFMMILILIIMIAVSAFGEYFLVQRSISAYEFSKGVTSFNGSGDINGAESHMLRATELYEYDAYFRSLSELQIARLRNIFLVSDTTSRDVLLAQFQTAFGDAVAYASKAVQMDSTNYLNWMSLGNVYASVVPLKVINDAYDNAIASYEKAIVKNPKSPAIYLVLARFEAANGDIKKARMRTEEALALKQDYAQAVFFLSQIEASEGNIKAAIESAERASLILQNDTDVFFHLGFLRYKNGDYDGALLALERAIALNSVYANARYFLGLSYDRVGRRGDAIVQFEDIEKLNPGNKEVKNILENLRADRGPFNNAILAPESIKKQKKH